MKRIVTLFCFSLSLCFGSLPTPAFSLPSFPSARPDTPPVLPSPYHRCTKPFKDLSHEAIFQCAEHEFWHAFSDGRLKVRQDADGILGTLIGLTEDSQELSRHGRLYALRGYLRLALALENARAHHLILGTMENDFKKAKLWDSENKTYDTFLDTIVMAKAAVFGNWEKAVAVAFPAFDILDAHPVNILALSGTTIGFPMTTGVPQKTIEILDSFVCPTEIAEFCENNTQHAPYARPGLNFHFAEAYARMGDAAKAEFYFKAAKASPGFAEWAYKDKVEKPLSDFDSYMAYWKAFKNEDSLIDKVYANQNYGCLLCHGR